MWLLSFKESEQQWSSRDNSMVFWETLWMLNNIYCMDIYNHLPTHVPSFSSLLRVAHVQYQVGTLDLRSEATLAERDRVPWIGYAIKNTFWTLCACVCRCAGVSCISFANQDLLIDSALSSRHCFSQYQLHSSLYLFYNFLRLNLFLCSELALRFLSP